jgi:hypothetical protein
LAATAAKAKAAAATASAQARGASLRAQAAAAAKAKSSSIALICELYHVHRRSARRDIICSIGLDFGSSCSSFGFDISSN